MPSMSEPSAITGSPLPQRRPPRRRHAGDACLDGEAVLLQQLRQVALRLELLERELGKREQAVDDLLRQLLRRSRRSRSASALEPAIEPRVAAARPVARRAERSPTRERDAHDEPEYGRSNGSTCSRSPRGTAARRLLHHGNRLRSEKPSRSTAPSVATALSPRATNAASSRTAMPRLPAVSIKREWPGKTSGRAFATTTFDLRASAADADEREPLVAAGLDDGPIAHERHRTPRAQVCRHLVAQRQHVELLGRARDAHARAENSALADLRVREQRKADLQRLAGAVHIEREHGRDEVAHDRAAPGPAA